MTGFHRAQYIAAPTSDRDFLSTGARGRNPAGGPAPDAPYIPHFGAGKPARGSVFAVIGPVSVVSIVVASNSGDPSGTTISGKVDRVFCGAQGLVGRKLTVPVGAWWRSIRARRSAAARGYRIGEKLLVTVVKSPRGLAVDLRSPLPVALPARLDGKRNRQARLLVAAISALCHLPRRARLALLSRDIRKVGLIQQWAILAIGRRSASRNQARGIMKQLIAHPSVPILSQVEADEALRRLSPKSWLASAGRRKLLLRWLSTPMDHASRAVVLEYLTQIRDPRAASSFWLAKFRAARIRLKWLHSRDREFKKLVNEIEAPDGTEPLQFLAAGSLARAFHPTASRRRMVERLVQSCRSARTKRVLQRWLGRAAPIGSGESVRSTR